MSHNRFLVRSHASHRARRIPSRDSSVLKTLNIRLPLRLVGPQDSPIVGQKPIDLSLDICCLRPHAGTACVQANLVAKLREQSVAAVVPRFGRHVDLVGLVDGVDGGLNVPETGKIRGFCQPKGVLIGRRRVGLTGRLSYFDRCHRIHPGFQYGSARMGLIGWNRKEYRIGGWHSGDCPITWFQ